MQFGSRIQYFRNKREMSQSALARLLGISQSYISEIEAGKKIPSFALVARIADALDVCICFKDKHECNCQECQNDCEK